MRVDWNFVNSIKQQYPAGTKIELGQLVDPYRDMPIGLKGIVAHVDDIGQIHCNWEDGSVLAVIPGVDAFHKVMEREKDQEVESENDADLER
jgi:hypothetical protein